MTEKARMCKLRGLKSDAIHEEKKYCCNFKTQNMLEIRANFSQKQQQEKQIKKKDHT